MAAIEKCYEWIRDFKQHIKRRRRESTEDLEGDQLDVRGCPDTAAQLKERLLDLRMSLE